MYVPVLYVPAAHWIQGGWPLPLAEYDPARQGVVAAAGAASNASKSTAEASMAGTGSSSDLGGMGAVLGGRRQDGRSLSFALSAICANARLRKKEIASKDF